MEKFKAMSFCCGFTNVKMGKIQNELTDREIAKRWPNLHTDSFAQGMIDGLKNDRFRYNLCREEAGIEVVGENNDE